MDSLLLGEWNGDRRPGLIIESGGGGGRKLSPEVPEKYLVLKNCCYLVIFSGIL